MLHTSATKTSVLKWQNQTLNKAFLS